MMMTPHKFDEYVLAFYGDGGIYDHGFTSEEVEYGRAILMANYADIDFDSVDRERVRDIVFNLRELERAEYA